LFLAYVRRDERAHPVYAERRIDAMSEVSSNVADIYMATIYDVRSENQAIPDSAGPG
jgi:hypothetical protein